MLSDKQWQILCFGHTSYDALICDGAIRSGKTSVMSVGFIDWAMEFFDQCNFIIGGVTVESAKRNVVNPMLLTKYLTDRYSMKWEGGQANRMVVTCKGHRNVFHVFGGKDEASYKTVQGITAAGCFLDEVALMPRSFVEQCMARCSVEGSKFWFNCNPGAPTHWFYQEWILKAKDKNAYHLRFHLTDNPALSDKIIKRYLNMYTGVFKKRYVDGEWVQAEGMIYPEWRDALEDTYEGKPQDYVVSIDYGTQNAFAAIKWLKDSKGKWHAVDEYYYSGRTEGHQKTDSDYVADMVSFTQDAGESKIVEVIIDPSASSFIAAMRRTTRFRVRKAINNVEDGIRDTAVCMQLGLIKISNRLEHLSQELDGYVWDDKKQDDKPVKVNDHCLSGSTMVDTENGRKPIRELVGTSGKVWSWNGNKPVLSHYHDCRMTRQSAKLIEIETDDSRFIKCTIDHPILTERGWVEAGELSTEDRIVTI